VLNLLPNPLLQTDAQYARLSFALCNVSKEGNIHGARAKGKSGRTILAGIGRFGA
jgi:hypothetical protein